MTGNEGMPEVVDFATWQAEIDALRRREKAHTHEGDAIAAARRRLPMVEVDAATPLQGPYGRVSLLDAFEGRQQLIGYYHMWHGGHVAAEQCEGCTFFTSQIRELSYLHSRDVTYAVLCQGSYEESSRYRSFLDLDVPWYSAEDSLDTLLGDRPRGPSPVSFYLRNGNRVFETYWTTGRGLEPFTPTHGLLDRTIYGRREAWEETPEGWPQPMWHKQVWRTSGRPIAQWSRIAAGRSDALRTGPA